MTDSEQLRSAGVQLIAGVDEAGRGACAGPMVIAACILPPQLHDGWLGLTDSKKLTPKRRDTFYDLIVAEAVAWSAIVIPPADIDSLGLQQMNIGGMQRAVEALQPEPEHVLTDAWQVPGLAMPMTNIIGGDAQELCIAAASVIAKVTRDRIMVEYDSAYPGYGFAGHKGYGTAAHARAMRTLGVCDIHRMSYANVQKAQAVFEEYELRKELA